MTYVSSPLRPLLVLLVLALCIGLAAPATQPQIHVKTSGDPSSNGSSWGNATTLRHALDIATGSDEIWIAEGVYTPGSSEGDSFTITGNQDGLKIYGGFDGSETSRDQRDPEANRTVLSGDVDGNDATNADGVTETAADVSGANSDHVVVFNGGNRTGATVGPNVTEATVLDGVTITGGQADGSGTGVAGGGVYCDGNGSGNECSPMLSGLTFAGNSAEVGGAIFIEGSNGESNPRISDVTFTENRASSSGGAIFIDGAEGKTRPRISNAVFTGNRVPTGRGGAITATGSNGLSHPRITSTLFIDNSASSSGGAIFFTGDNGSNGATVVNSVFADNGTDHIGFDDGSTNTSPRFVNCTFTGAGSRVVTVEYFDNAQVPIDVVNSILWKNGGDVVATNHTVSNPDATVDVTYSIVEEASYAEGNPNGGTGNRNTAPQFFDSSDRDGRDGRLATADDGLNVLPGSPALDAGTNAALDTTGDGTRDVTTDLTGANRVQDGTVNLGAYEAGSDRTIHVDASASGGDGRSWGTAFASLQNALSVADGNDEIWLAEGTYAPDGAGDIPDGTADTSFVVTGVQDGLEIYGGFASGDAFADRNPAEHPVVLSGDVDGNDGPLAPDSDSDGDAGTPTETDHLNGDNSQHVLVLDGTETAIGRSTLIDGVTIAAGQADDGSSLPTPTGGGVLCDGSGSGGQCSPTMRNVTFRANTAKNGGGAFAAYAHDGTAEPLIVNATFFANAVSEANANGGALYNWGDGGNASPVLVNTSFAHNHAPDRGGAVYYYALGGTSDGRIVNSVFVNNEAGDGGAIGNNRGSPVLTNVTGTRNRAEGDGGALFNVISSATPRIENSIFWGNRADGAGNQVFNKDGATPTFAHSLVQGSGGSANWSGPGTDDGGNLDTDPKFAKATAPAGSDGVYATADDGLRLTAGSPAVDAGTGSVLPSDIADLDSDGDTGESLPYALTGASRVQNGTVNLGAYEQVDAPRTLYVDAGVGSSGDGTSWSSAYATLQAALATADSNDEIWIAEGIYTPDPGGTDTTRSFRVSGGQNGLKMYGGFASGDAFADRNPGDHPVVLSGDLDGDDANRTAGGATPTAADIRGPNSHNVLLFDAGNAVGTRVGPNLTHATVVSGVTVSGGQADGSGSAENGGGVYCDGTGAGNECSPTLRRVVFVGNQASGNGGALYNNGSSGTSSPAVLNTLFGGNSAQFGGAIYNEGGNGTSSPVITNATFTGNSAGFGGAALYSYATTSGGESTPTLTNTILWENGGGAGVSNSNATPTFAHSLVQGSGGSDNWSGPGTDDGGNLDADPQFASAADPDGIDDTFATSDDGLRVTGGSPVLDGGTPDTTGLDLPDSDLVATPRVVNNDPDAVTATIDLGAYEASSDTELPVEMASFEATATGDEAVQVRWETASETGNAGFQIQREPVKPSRRDGSTKGEDWQTVGSVDGAGTTDEPQSYRFTDEDLPYAADTLTYRLKQVDTDGSAAYTEAITVARSGIETVQLLGTYPNPARSHATVRFALPEASASGAGSKQEINMHLYDVLGRRVHTVRQAAEAGRHQFRLDTSRLSSGVYFLRLQAQGTVRTQKLTVVK